LVGPRTPGVAGYYAGTAAAEKTPPPAAAGRAGDEVHGPDIELPDESARGEQRITVAVSYRKLLEVTHFHLFTVPVFLLIIAHLFTLTGLSPTAKLVWIAMGSASSLLRLAAPWLVRYGGEAWGFSYPRAGAVMGGGLS